MPDHTKGAAPDAPRRKRRAGVKPALIEVANEQPHFEVADGAVETSDIGDTPQTAIQAANALTDRVVPDGDTSSTARQVLAQLRAPGATEAARRRAGQLLLRAYSRRMIGVACRKFRLNEADAEEVVSDTACTFMLDCPAACRNPEGWMWVVFKHYAISRLLYNKAKCRAPEGGIVSLDAPVGGSDAAPSLIDTLADPAAPLPEDVLSRRQRDDAVLACVAEIAASSSQLRATVLLLLIKGRSYEDIALALGKKPGTLRDMVHRTYHLTLQLLKDKIV